MWRRVLVVVAIVVAVVAGWFVWLLNATGEFRTLTPHFDGTCTAVPGVVGAEDITIHPRTGIAYISSYDRRAVMAGKGRDSAAGCSSPAGRMRCREVQSGGLDRRMRVPTSWLCGDRVCRWTRQR
jgi:hypothetical protein